MAVTYERVRQVISQPPERRRDFDVNFLLPWFQKRSYVFKNLKAKLLCDVIKNLQYVPLKQDEIIIRQGDKGECMYIILRGQVTIYNNDGKISSDEDGQNSSQTVSSNVENFRQLLGNFVVSLKSGASFGEVALMSDDCIRTATVVTDSATDLMVIGRDLYNRSIKSVLKAEFDQKTNFIAQSIYFQNWSARYKKQLAMALEKETLSYESLLTKQGNHVEAIYFILNGEVKVEMDPQFHASQYPKLLPSWNNSDVDNNTTNDENCDALRNIGVDLQKMKKMLLRRQSVGICYLGVNESIGDAEVLLGLSTYMQTATCTRETEVLVMELKHFERLLVRRNPRTIDSMRDGLALRVQSRIQQNPSCCFPLYTAILFHIAGSNKNDSDVNSSGLLLNRNNQNLKQSKQKGLTTDSKPSLRNAFTIDLTPLADEAVEAVDDAYGGLLHSVNGMNIQDVSGDPDVDLAGLEDKLHRWMSDRRVTLQESGKHPSPRILKFHRSQLTQSDQKPGMVVRLRPKKHVSATPISFYNGNDRDEKLENLDREKSPTPTELAYYKMALTATIPVFKS